MSMFPEEPPPKTEVNPIVGILALIGVFAIIFYGEEFLIERGNLLWVGPLAVVAYFLYKNHTNKEWSRKQAALREQYEREENQKTD